MKRGMFVKQFIAITLILFSNSVFAAEDSAAMAAGKAGAAAGIGIAVNAVATKIFGAECNSGQGYACPIAIAAVTAGVGSLASYSGAKKTESKLKSGTAANFDLGQFNGSFPDFDPSQIYAGTGSGFDNADGTTRPGVDPGTLSYARQYRDAIRDLKAKGVTYDPKTDMVTTPKGKIPLSQVGNTTAMLGNGMMKPEDVAKLEKLMDQVKDKAKVSSVAIGGAGGGGGGAAGRTKFVVDQGPGFPGLGAFMGGQQIGKPQTAGLTRQLASGEVIGSQTDNIFEMINRSYQKNDARGLFFKGAP
jgi:hypothetical protein